MNKIIGYALSGIGIVVLAVSSPNVSSKLGFLAKLPEKSLLLVGAGLVVVGVIVLMLKEKTSSKVKHAQAEVPIYEGTGKNRKIVGYQKA
jgi:hypothetical protein